MGCFTRFASVRTNWGCRESFEEAEQTQDETEASTNLDIQAQRLQTTRKESPKSWDIFCREKER